VTAHNNYILIIISVNPLSHDHILNQPLLMPSLALTFS